jgi:hypothetical protein
MSSNNGAAHPSPRNRLAPLPKPPLEVRKEEAVAALHEQFDKLNAAWTEKEKELVAMHVPTRVWYCYRTIEDDCGNPRLYYHLTLGKWRGQWRILHSIEHLDSGELDERPIVEASFDHRVEATEHFKKFREEVIEAAEESVGKVQDAIETLSR